MDITLKVFRYNPEAGRHKPSFDVFTLEDVDMDLIADGTAVDIKNNSLTNHATASIYNNSPFDFDLTNGNNTFDGVNQSSPTRAQLFDIEDQRPY